MKYLGTISGENLDSISRLYRRKAALMELAKMLDMDSKEVPGRLYDKLVEDLIATNLKMTMWWKAIAGTTNQMIPGRLILIHKQFT